MMQKKQYIVAAVIALCGSTMFGMTEFRNRSTDHVMVILRGQGDTDLERAIFLKPFDGNRQRRQDPDAFLLMKTDDPSVTDFDIYRIDPSSHLTEFVSSHDRLMFDTVYEVRSEGELHGLTVKKNPDMQRRQQPAAAVPRQPSPRAAIREQAPGQRRLSPQPGSGRSGSMREESAVGPSLLNSGIVGPMGARESEKTVPVRISRRHESLGLSNQDLRDFVIFVKRPSGQGEDVLDSYVSNGETPLSLNENEYRSIGLSVKGYFDHVPGTFGTRPLKIPVLPKEQQGEGYRFIAYPTDRRIEEAFLRDVTKGNLDLNDSSNPEVIKIFTERANAYDGKGGVNKKNRVMQTLRHIDGKLDLYLEPGTIHNDGRMKLQKVPRNVGPMYNR